MNGIVYRKLPRRIVQDRSQEQPLSRRWVIVHRCSCSDAATGPDIAPLRKRPTHTRNTSTKIPSVSKMVIDLGIRVRELFTMDVDFISESSMEHQTLASVADAAIAVLHTGEWNANSRETVRNEVWLIPASKDGISYLFQFNVRQSSQPRIQPSVAIERPTAFHRYRCVDFVWADVPVAADGTLTNEGLENIKKAIKQADGLLKARSAFDQSARHCSR